MASNPSYLTTAEAIAYLRTTERTLYRLLAASKIPALRVGHQWRFRQADLDRWVDRQTQASGSPERDLPEVAPAFTNCRVLVVDDEPSVREMLESLLATIGHDVEVAPDVVTAMALLRSGRFDLVVMNLNIPGVDGDELACEAKRLWPGIKVILTADPDQSSAIRSAGKAS